MSLQIKKGGKAFIVLLVIISAICLKLFWWDKKPKEVGEAQKVDKVTLADAPEASLKGTAAIALSLPIDKIAVNGGTKITWQIMAWNSQFPLHYANGGPTTTQGSLFDKAKLQVNIVRQDDCFKTIAQFIKFAKDYKDNPNIPGFIMSFMGDGMPGFSTMMKELDQLGPEYQPIIIYHMGRSNGEDQFMAPPTWKQNPKNALGGTVAGVELDGDMNIVFKWAGDNGIPINPNPKLYDSTALNVITANDFLDASNKYITDFSEDKELVSNGKTTGQKVKVKVDAVTTWTPGDVNISSQKGGLVRIASTKEYSSQMPNATVVLKKWANDHRTDVESIIAALGQAGDQVRSFNDAKEFAAKVSAKVYNEESQGKDYKYWLKYYNGIEEKDKQALKVQLGGSMAFNLADAANMFGLGNDKIDRYKITYETFGNMLAKLYPDRMKNYTPYNKITDKSFLMSVIANHPELMTGEALKAEYSNEITSEISSKSYQIQFAIGSDDIQPESYKLLDEIFNSAIVAEGLKLGVYGHTDNSGNEQKNQILSEQRANAVKNYLLKKGLKEAQIEAKGYGSSLPLAENNNALNMAKNRRVQIVLGN